VNKLKQEYFKNLYLKEILESRKRKLNAKIERIFRMVIDLVILTPTLDKPIKV